MIRGLATGEIRTGNRMRVVWREARAAVASAMVLSVASFFRVLLTPGATTVATLAVSTAMGATVIGAVMFGTIAPIVLDGMGVSSGMNLPVRSILVPYSVGTYGLCWGKSGRKPRNSYFMIRACETRRYWFEVLVAVLQ